MRVKSLAHKNQMGQKKITNSSTSWVPSEFSQTDLTKAQKDGLIAEGDQVVFPSTERIPKPSSGYRVMFLAFLLHGLSFLPTSFSAGFSLFTVCSFTSSHQTRFYTLLALSLFASLFWGSNPIGFSGNFSFASALMLLCRRSLSWAGLLFPPALRFIIWSSPWLPQCKVGRKKWFYIKDQKNSSFDQYGIAPFDANQDLKKLTCGIRLPWKLRWKTSSHC
jgi:hypothetical protein